MSGAALFFLLSHPAPPHPPLRPHSRSRSQQGVWVEFGSRIDPYALLARWGAVGSGGERPTLALRERPTMGRRGSLRTLGQASVGEEHLAVDPAGGPRQECDNLGDVLRSAKSLQRSGGC